MAAGIRVVGNEETKPKKRGWSRKKKEDQAPVSSTSWNQDERRMLEALRAAYQGDLNESVIRDSILLENLTKSHEIVTDLSTHQTGQPVIFRNKKTGTSIAVTKDTINFVSNRKLSTLFISKPMSMTDSLDMAKFAALDYDMRTSGVELTGSKYEKKLLRLAIKEVNKSLNKDERVKIKDTRTMRGKAKGYLWAAATGTVGFIMKPITYPLQTMRYLPEHTNDQLNRQIGDYNKKFGLYKLQRQIPLSEEKAVSAYKDYETAGEHKERLAKEGTSPSAAVPPQSDAEANGAAGTFANAVDTNGTAAANAQKIADRSKGLVQRTLARLPGRRSENYGMSFVST